MKLQSKIACSEMEINVKKPWEDESVSGCECVWEKERDVCVREWARETVWDVWEREAEGKKNFVRWFTAKKKENTKWGNLFALLVKKWSCWDEAAEAVMVPLHINNQHNSKHHFSKHQISGHHITEHHNNVNEHLYFLDSLKYLSLYLYFSKYKVMC